MKELYFELKELTRRCGEGSHWTQAVRHRGLQAMARELVEELGFNLQHPRNLKPKHVAALVAHWKAGGVSDATIRNRLGWVRWLAVKISKPGLLPNSNETFGLAERTPFKGLKAKTLDREKLATVADRRISLALRLQQAFGLRREEAIKFQVGRADRGDYIALKPSWTKGGRYREIPVTDPRQRALLDEVRAVAGPGSLIPDGATFYEQRKAYENATLKAGLRNNHGLRHWYACWRYTALTGEKPPALGGRTCDAMSESERARDKAARLQVAHELGHNRVDVTDTYLGRRWAPKVAR
jgi:integrase